MPPALSVIDACNEYFKNVRQAACFDTAFHKGLPLLAASLPLPAELLDGARAKLLAARELASGEDVNFDIVPQIQITLDKRQHIMLNIGVRTALNNRSREDTQVMFYVLWDWFDGTLFEGW